MGFGHVYGLTETCDTIAAAGGIERVVAAMGAHVGHPGVQEAGCGALWNLVVGNTGAL